MKPVTTNKALLLKYSADKEVKDQKKRVTKNRIKMDLQSWRRQNSWNYRLVCPTEKKADFDAERIRITRKFIFCWHQNPLYLLVFQPLFNRCRQEHSRRKRLTGCWLQKHADRQCNWVKWLDRVNWNGNMADSVIWFEWQNITSRR